MRTPYHLPLVALMLLVNASSACAEELMGNMESFAGAGADATTIDAQRLEIYLDREMRAFGDAEIHSDGQVIKGDRIDYNPINHEIHATGNVRIEQANSIAEGSELRLKMDDREGEMTEPVFHSGGEGERKSRGSAKTLFFEGPTLERLKSARYTTCEDGRDDWFLRAGELEINHHTETATATNASIEFKGIPILYTPWVDFPFNNQRKSGFLAPTFGTTTRSGFEFMLPYYWNIAPDMDATVAPRYLGKRGLQLQGEYRYLSPSYNGTDVIELLPNDNQTSSNRYYANLTHSHNFGNGWTGKVHYERVSDAQYFSDMSTSIVITSRVNLAQDANLRYDGADWHFLALAQQYQTLDTSFPYQRLPQLALNGTEAFGPVDASLWSEFVRFDLGSKGQSYFNTVGGAGKFGGIDEKVTGNRFTAYPSLSLPLTPTYGYVTPKFGVHFTKYDLNGTDYVLMDNNGLNPQLARYGSETRTLPIFSLDAGLYFDRDMRVVKNNYTQTIEPRLYYVYIPDRNQDRIPIFDTGLSDINLATIFTENQFSGGDRVNDANQLTLGVTSRLIDQKTGVQRLAATVAERFYFSDQNVVMPVYDHYNVIRKGKVHTNLHSDLIAALNLNLVNHWYADAAWQYNTDLSRTIRSNISTRYQPEPGKVLNMAYRYNSDNLGQPGFEQIDVSTEWPIAQRWYGLGRINYSLRSSNADATGTVRGDRRGLAELVAGLEYDAGCWQGRAVIHRMETATANANYSFFFQLELGGFSSIGTSPLAVLQRNIPGYTNSRLIPDASR